ncbi:phosphonoacetaldehyde reductase, partial [Pelagibacteraceae bacterium]|nr:phosphonoacetaldehyde reductase [Pelagibacteraceae bacterium]
NQFKVMWNYFNPVEIIFGENRFTEVHDALKNKNYIIITHPEDIFKKYSDELKSSSNPPLSIMTDVQPNPDYKDILELQNKFSSINESVDYILAIGGGSVTDTAKAIAAFKDKQEYLTDFVRNKKNPRVENPIKIIAIPTTSGTSSELTCWATIWDKEKNNKLSLAHKSLYAEKAIIDPSIMVDKPLGLTISTGLDALSHSMESIWNINANPISASHAIQASKLVLENLPLLTKDLRNVELRSNIALACVHAGLAFSNTKTAIAHNLSYPVTLNYGIQHGIACSFTLPMITKSMVGIDSVAEERLKLIFNNNLENAADQLSEFMRSLEVPLNLNEIKVPVQEWNNIVDDAFLGERGKNFIGNKEAFISSAKSMGLY